MPTTPSSQERLADQVRQLETLRSMALALTSETDSAMLLQEIVRQAVALLDAKSGGIYEYRQERGELQIVSDWGRPNDLLGRTLREGEGMAGHLLRSGADHLIVDDYNRSPHRASAYTGGRFFGSVVEVALRWRDSFVGVLYVDDLVGRRFSEEDARLLRLFADHAAIAIVNARLMERDRLKVRRLERLSQVSSSLIGGLDSISLQERLDLVVTHAAEILDAETSGICLVDGDAIVLRASAGHQPGHANIGQAFPIVDAPRSGLISFIAASQAVFQAHGPDLDDHHAVRHAPSHTPSGACFSVLAVPLFARSAGAPPRYLGFIRADNKRDPSGHADAMTRFTKEDIWILQLFADVVVNAIQAADLVGQLREQKEQFERLMQGAPVGIVVNDEAGRIVQVNRCALAVLGCGPDTIVGRPVQRIYDHPDEALAVGQQLRAAPDHSIAQRTAYLRGPAGERIPVQLAATWLYGRQNEPAGSVGFFIDLREARRREELLGALDQASRHIRQLKERGRLMQEIVQLAVNLVGADAGGLFVCRPHLGEMELEISYQLPPELRGRRQPISRGLAGEAYATGEIVAAGRLSARREPILGACDLRSVICLPLHDQAGSVAAVLTVARASDDRQLEPNDHDVLTRFAAHAALALQTSELFGREQRFFGRLRFLHELGNFIQTQQSVPRVAHAVLTGVTAGFGLGFNRAALLLVDSQRASLRGVEGIGALTLAEAKSAWDRHHSQGREAFGTYCRLLESKVFETELTSLGARIRSLRLPLADDGDDLFARLINQPVTGATVVAPEELPPAFAAALHADGPVVIVPLVLGGTAIGLIVADNQFTRFPISSEDQNALVAMADTAAVVIGNLQLYETSARSVRELRAMHSLAEHLSAGKGSRALLTDIARDACELVQAQSAVVWSYDHVKQEFLPEHSVAVHVDEELWRRLGQDNPRPGGTAETVMRHRAPLDVEDVEDVERYPFVGEQNRFLCRAIGARSFVAVPLELEDEPVGVLFVNFPTPRTFSDEERDTVRAYASYVALILRRARLQEQLGKAREAARMISKVTVIEDLHKTLSLVAEGIMSALRCDAITVYEYLAERDGLSYPPVTRGLRFPERVARFADIPPESVVYRTLRRAEMRVVADTAADAEFRDLRFVRDEAIVSCLAIPLRSNQEPVGVLFVNYRSRHSFSADERAGIQLFADQAADAIRYAQAYERESARSRALKEIHLAAQLVTGSPNLEMRAFLEVIARQAFELTSSPKRQIRFANIRLYEDGKARYVAAYPSAKLEAAVAAIGETIDIYGGGFGGRIGVMGRAIIEARTQLVHRVAADPDYIASDSRTRSELAVPILAHHRVLGVINIEHDEEFAFTTHDCQILETLAAHAAIAIQNAERFRDLAQMGLDVGSPHAVERFHELAQLSDFIGSHQIKQWITMVRDGWMHAIARDVGIARTRLRLARLALPAEVAPAAAADLDALDLDLQSIAEHKLALPLSTEHALTEVPVNRLVCAYLESRWQHSPYRATELEIDLADDLDRQVVVRASPYWLEQAIDILVDNAVHAMAEAGSPLRRVTVHTTLVDQHVAIAIRDTGPGIPAPIAALLFKQRIPKQPGQRGAGVGLILATTFVHTFNGRITCEQTGATGTTMVIRLPCRPPASSAPQLAGTSDR
jgi:PAS domain S-box-containing protein